MFNTFQQATVLDLVKDKEGGDGSGQPALYRREGGGGHFIYQSHNSKWTCVTDIKVHVDSLIIV